MERAAIVTGASRGIGAAVAERLARDGLRVVVDFAANVREATAVVTRITARGGTALGVQADVADPAAVLRLFDEAERAFGVVDVLVNNAGVLATTALADVGDAEFDRLVAINLKGRHASTAPRPVG